MARKKTPSRPLKFKEMTQRQEPEQRHGGIHYGVNHALGQGDASP
jgi:hypothetical protein